MSTEEPRSSGNAGRPIGGRSWPSPSSASRSPCLSGPCSATRARRWKRASCWSSRSGCCDGDAAQPGLPAPVRPGEPVGPGRVVQGVRRQPGGRAHLRAAAAARDHLRRVRPRPAVGAQGRHRRRADRGAHLDHRHRPHRAGVERRGRPRPGGADRRAAGAAAHRRGPRHRRALGQAGPQPARRGRAAGRLALLFRPDLVIGVGLGFGGVLWGLGRARWKSFAVGLAAGRRAVRHPTRDGRSRALDPGHAARPGVQAAGRPLAAGAAVVEPLRRRAARRGPAPGAALVAAGGGDAASGRALVLSAPGRGPGHAGRRHLACPGRAAGVAARECCWRSGCSVSASCPRRSSGRTRPTCRG